tara:strand:- start:40 stop:219 length:180 start_codon:yes stop_codon:yes gene_type:complete
VKIFKKHDIIKLKYADSLELDTKKIGIDTKKIKDLVVVFNTNFSQELKTVLNSMKSYIQ